MIVRDVLFVHDLHAQGLVIGPIDGDRLAVTGLLRLGGVERPQETDMNNSTAQLAQFQPREDRIPLLTLIWRVIRMVVAPKRGKHS